MILYPLKDRTSLMFFQLLSHSHIAIPQVHLPSRGKVAPLQILEKRSQFISTFHALGQSTEVQTKTFNELEQFVCCMYGKPKYASVNKLRYDLFMQKFRLTSGNVLSSVDGIDLSLLPPYKNSLYMHIQRANYQAME